MQTILDKIKETPIIPVYYNDDLDDCIQKMTSCYEGGIKVFEFVNRGIKSLENFKALLAYKNKHYPDLKLGIGTIKTKEQAINFAKLGAEFLVSPIVSEDIAAIAKEYNLLWIPGCMTPTEIALAEELDVKLVKLFPADALGVKYLKSIKPLFPNLKFMPTGGVQLTEESIKEWRAAGVFAIGFGSNLFVQSDDGESITERCTKCLNWTK